MKKLLLNIMFISFLVGGCSTAPTMNLVSQSGEPMPNPYYIINSTSGIPIRATYYYVGFTEVIDADNSIHYNPIYLDRHNKYTIKKGRYKQLHLVLRVFNPTGSTYRVHTHIKVQRKNDRNAETTNGVFAMSELNYRQYMFQLPIGGDKKQIKFGVSLSNKDDRETYLRTGAFNYELNQVGIYMKGGVKEIKKLALIFRNS